jgi:hypothetical protein
MSLLYIVSGIRNIPQSTTFQNLQILTLQKCIKTAYPHSASKLDRAAAHAPARVSALGDLCFPLLNLKAIFCF